MGDAEEAGQTDGSDDSEAPADLGTDLVADVLALESSGDPGAYTFAVTVKSPDLGCEQYANWWEVLSEDGALIHRRILGHSHVDEQPFTRSSGPIDLDPDTTVIVRAHLYPGGYGGLALIGSVNDGFSQHPGLETEFAAAIEDVDPQPDGCAF